MSERPWYRRYASDFVTGVSGFSAEKIGVYAILLELMYARRKALDGARDSDRQALARTCGCTTRRFNVLLAELAEVPPAPAKPKITIDAAGRISNPKFEKWLRTERGEERNDNIFEEKNAGKNRDKSEIIPQKNYQKNDATLNDNNGLGLENSTSPPRSARTTTRNQIPDSKKKDSLPSVGVPLALEPPPVPEPPKRPPKPPLAAAVQAYNEAAAEAGWPIARNALNGRGQALAVRLREHGIVVWTDAMQRAAQSDFLTGKRGRSEQHSGWTPDLGFFVKAENFTKLIEGRYDNRAAHQRSSVIDITKGKPP